MKHILISLLIAAKSIAGDITVTHDSSVASLTLEQIQRTESARSLWDYIVLDNGLTGSQTVVQIIVKPMSLGVAGMRLVMIFVDALVTITDTAAATADTINLSAAFTSSANDVMELIHNGTKWLEISRSVN